ncbi:Swt1 family HEPN domain-containing protein [Deltaproteobacteria bacterium TL4]
MAITNHERVGKCLTLLKDGLQPFTERELKAVYGDQWLEQAQSAVRNLPAQQGEALNWDSQALLMVMWNLWNSVFSNKLGHAERSLVSELREVRNQWAHQTPFSTDDAYRALDSMVRLLTAVSAEEAREVDRHRQELLRIRFSEEARRERRKAAVTPIEGQPSVGLKPWREIIMPHPDVATGRYQQAEFAADLAAVHRGEKDTASEYKDPREFFQRTYVTEGLRHLLQNALSRLIQGEGDPVIELQTNFGGGKTHSMLALYHLFSGITTADVSDVESILNEMSIDSIPAVNRCVLVGTSLAPGQSRKHADGTETRTFWGEMAWQLGKAEGYALVADSDKSGVSPGSEIIKALFEKYGPCLILIDEWVAFIRQLYNVDGLPAGSFDANLSFAQSLTEAATQTTKALVVASLPASDIEIGGEGGRAALERLRNTFARIESTWRPANAEESFEIVRRRLFQPITEPNDFASRDAVIDAFSHYYRDQSQEFPNDCREGDYRRRMQAAYPIHPELFDRLYNDWSTLDKFQRTRGVLRLMASVIHALWERNDPNLLIMPATVPIDDGPVQFELTRYMEDNWVPVIEKDIDGAASLPLSLDRENPNLGRYSACRRVTRTIYMGSAPTAKTNNPGLDERHIKLGCVQPGESVAIFGDALRRLTDKATHLYVDRSRYWFNTQPSVNRLAEDRRVQFQEDKDALWEELKVRLKKDRQTGEFSGIHLIPSSASDVQDTDSVRLVVIGPQSPHTSKDEYSPAIQNAVTILSKDSQRKFQNMLVFLAPDNKRLQELETVIARYLAWHSIHEQKDELNLDTFMRNQAQTKREQANQSVDALIQETYIWLLFPTQPNPQMPPLVWEERKIQGPEALAVKASRKLINEEQLIPHFAALRLRMAMDNYHLWRNQPHVRLKQIWEDFARYPYLPRLKDAQVLIGAVQDGIGQMVIDDNFGYAEGYDEAKQRYINLKARHHGSVIMDEQSLLVQPEAALEQLSEQEPVSPVNSPAGTHLSMGTTSTGGGTAPVVPPTTAKKITRFHGTVEVNSQRLGRDAGTIAEEVVQHLSSLVGTDVKITLEISSHTPDGVPDHTVRTVMENAKTLKFESMGFEEE